ncbi:hypothetical protein BDV98DRAFT_129440 [Pterulicium gracile]|uniref:Uncharacterized protein n=1 Tax=Pterulicium gracile TaxID=1884261 RepID=A0A5C3QD47_9AGAR|nr:hypothetical protein BDV98DRAFT_129440 [Pterula gracilis]
MCIHLKQTKPPLKLDPAYRRSRKGSTASSIASTSSLRLHSDSRQPTTSRIHQNKAYGSFTLTRDAATSLSGLCTDTGFNSSSPWTSSPWSASPLSSPKLQHRTRLSNDSDADSALDSPIDTVDVLLPSITRTSSLESSGPSPSISGGLSAPPFLRCDRKIQSAPGPNLQARPVPKSPDGWQMNPILAGLERRSKLCTTGMACATCKKRGMDYSRCPRCAEAWCSRECRLKGGKRHECAVRKA